MISVSGAIFTGRPCRASGAHLLRNGARSDPLGANPSVCRRAHLEQPEDPNVAKGVVGQAIQATIAFVAKLGPGRRWLGASRVASAIGRRQAVGG